MPKPEMVYNEKCGCMTMDHNGYHDRKIKNLSTDQLRRIAAILDEPAAVQGERVGAEEPA